MSAARKFRTNGMENGCERLHRWCRGFKVEWRGITSRAAIAIAAISCAGSLGGCSPAFITPPIAGVSASQNNISPECREVVVKVRTSVSDAGVTDVEAMPVPGFSIFRVNRFLEKLGERFASETDTAIFDAWAARLLNLDEEATRVELANLPTEHRKRLGLQIFGRPVDRQEIMAKWNSCSRTLSRSLLASAQIRRDLVNAAKVPENYSELARTTGLFPVMSIPVAAGWEKWKSEHLPTFYQSQSDLPVSGDLVEFAPPAAGTTMRASEVRDIIERSRDPRLGIPEPEGRDLRLLFEAFAPHWLVDVGGPYDLLGHPALNSAGEAAVDVNRPTVFTRVSYAVIGDRILLQLNYSIWFQERPLQSPVDLLGGRLDGLIWRVTLGVNGKPIVYDSIHACGCYHLLFPVQEIEPPTSERSNSPLRERPAILSGVPTLKAGQRIELRVASASHYLQSVRVSNTKNNNSVRRRYVLANDSGLRSLSLSGNGRRSLFRPDGIVAGTERLERFLLWPTGVLNPGAMRQWGHHAVAFADKRHFDDPILFETILGW